jgi:fido (protein-threonine AMPylation protein)
MPLTPGYGETPLPHDELTALLPEVVDVLDKPITRAAVYDLEQGLQDRVVDELMPSALDGSLPLDELFSDYFVRDLHTRMFGPVWNWAGAVAAIRAQHRRRARAELQYDWELDKTRTSNCFGPTTDTETSPILRPS